MYATNEYENDENWRKKKERTTSESSAYSISFSSVFASNVEASAVFFFCLFCFSSSVFVFQKMEFNLKRISWSEWYVYRILKNGNNAFSCVCVCVWLQVKPAQGQYSFRIRSLKRQIIVLNSWRLGITSGTMLRTVETKQILPRKIHTLN